MMKINDKRTLPALVALGISISGVAQASLIDRGGGMVYDDVLNITWLKDTNYAKTSGYDADGRMSWIEAKTWAENLSYGGYTDWRLPDVKPVNGSYFDFNGFNTGMDGSVDSGYNITSQNSEMPYMFHVNLGNLSVHDTSGDIRDGQSGIDWGLVNIGGFDNFERYLYWTSVDFTYGQNPDFWSQVSGQYTENPNIS